MKLIVSCFVSLMLIANTCFASITLPNANNLFNGTDGNFVETLDSELGGGLNTILLAVYKVGYVVALISTGVIAIKLLLTTPAKKAEVKAAIMPYLIGLLLLVAGVTIAIKVIEIYTGIF